MNVVVLDTSVLVRWFRPDGDIHSGRARQLREEFEAGALSVIAPTLLGLQMLNIAGREWGWPLEDVLELAVGLDDLGFELVEPELPAVASWVARGLTSYAAAYVAVAEATGVPLLTADERLLDVARGVAFALAPGLRP